MYLISQPWGRPWGQTAAPLPLLRPGQSNYYCRFTHRPVSPTQLTSSRGAWATRKGQTVYTAWMMRGMSRDGERGRDGTENKSGSSELAMVLGNSQRGWMSNFRETQKVVLRLSEAIRLIWILHTLKYICVNKMQYFVCDITSWTYINFCVCVPLGRDFAEPVCKYYTLPPTSLHSRFILVARMIHHICDRGSIMCYSSHKGRAVGVIWAGRSFY